MHNILIFKRSHFNKYPFLLLLFIHATLLLYTLYKNNDRKRLFVLLISNIGIAYLFEYFVVNLFSGYQYKPSFFKNKSIDNIVGAILSQAIYVPFTAIYISSFHLSWKAKWLISLYFSLIESLFTRIDIYKQNWWKTRYTFLLLPIYFYISDVWYTALKKGNKHVCLVSEYFLTLVTNVNILFILAVFRKIKFGTGLLFSWGEHFIIGPLYSIVHSLLLVSFIRRNTLNSKLFGLIILLALDLIFIKTKLLQARFPTIIWLIPFHLGMIILSSYYHTIVNQLSASPEKKEQQSQLEISL